jgi:hypothetical protein
VFSCGQRLQVNSRASYSSGPAVACGKSGGGGFRSTPLKRSGAAFAAPGLFLAAIRVDGPNCRLCAETLGSGSAALQAPREA